MSDDNWYIEEYLGYSRANKAREAIHKYKEIVSEGFRTETQDIYMCGSAKMGFSLSPPRLNETSKLFMPFNDDEKVRKVSDIDVAIISDKLFCEYWELYRTSFRPIYQCVYDEHIIREIYRGFINEKNVLYVNKCRASWNKMVVPIRSQLKKELHFRHEINFRVYRSRFDFESYSRGVYKGLRKRSEE